MPECFLHDTLLLFKVGALREPANAFLELPLGAGVRRASMENTASVSPSREDSPPLRRCFASDCEEIGVCPDVARDGVIWCAIHAQLISYCSVCGRTPLCRIGVLSIDRDPDGGVRAPLHPECRTRLDALVKSDTVLQRALADIRTRCAKLSNQNFCEADCDACRTYIVTKDDAREKLQSECIHAALNALHEEYARKGDDDSICERCDAPRNVQWSQNAAYLCRTCERELDETPTRYRKCSQCGNQHASSEFVPLEPAWDETGAICPRCFEELVSPNATERCILCTATDVVWSKELEACICPPCLREQDAV